MFTNRLGLFTVTFVKLFNTTTSLSRTLLTSEERMAFGANVNTDVFFNGTSFELITASASYSGLFVIWMDTLFHSLLHLFPVINIILLDYTINISQNQVAYHS